MANTEVSQDLKAKWTPWEQLRQSADPTGLRVGEDAVWASANERDEYFHRPLFGERFNTALFLKPEREFNQMMFVKTGARSGDRVLVIGEALEPMQLIELGRETLQSGVEIVPYEMRHLAAAHNGGHWGVYREISAGYGDAEFDSVISAQWHHCDDLQPEVESLLRIIKPGGKLVLVDNGPSAYTFEVAKSDVVLNWLFRTFVTWAGSRHTSTSEAFDYQRSIWLSNSVEAIFEVAKRVLRDAHLWEYKGMAMIDGTRPA